MKKFLIYSSIVLVILLGVLAIGNLDYTISVSLVNEHSLWANFFNFFGEIPAYFGLWISVVILTANRSSKKIKGLIEFIVGLIFLSLLSFMMVLIPINYAFEETGIPSLWYGVIVVLGLIVFGLSIYLTTKKKQAFKGMSKAGIVLLLLVISEILAVNVIKMIWARPRMRSIDDVSEFKHWYEINGWTTDNELKSFPSGHTANAMVSLGYLVFVPFIKKLKAKHIIIFAIIWTSLVALSRVVLGAHFLSDVIVGSYITIWIYALLNKYLLK